MGLLLITVSFSHTKQINKEISRTQATNAAEMGLKIFNSRLDQFLKDQRQDPPESFTVFKKRLDSNPELQGFNQTMQSFQNSPVNRLTIEKEQLSENELQWTIHSIGLINDDERTITQVKRFTYKNNDDSDNNGSDRICESESYMGVEFPCLDGILYKNGSLSKWGNIEIHGKIVNGSVHGIKFNNLPDDEKINGSVTTNGVYDRNLIVNGATNIGSGTVFRGNVKFNGSISSIGTDIESIGYIYHNGSLSLSPQGSGEVIFNRTVYSNGSITVYTNNSTVRFKGGIISNGSISLTAVGNGRIIIGNDESHTHFPVNVETGATVYD
jgi:hypothetical protein